MKRSLKCFAVISLFLCAVLAGCSQSQEQETEKSSVEVMTDKVAEKAVNKIRTPMDKARLTRELGEERTKAIDEALQNR